MNNTTTNNTADLSISFDEPALSGALDDPKSIQASFEQLASHSESSNEEGALESLDQPSQAAPSFTKVNILVSGTPHRIQCPSSEVANLNHTVDTINAALREIRRASGKNPSNEELLTLHCLNLHDEISELKKQLKQAQERDSQAITLIDGILKNHRAP